MRLRQTKSSKRAAMGVAAMLLGLVTLHGQIIQRVIDVAPVWAGHPVGFSSLVRSNRQYVAFYDAQRRMTVAMRFLSETNWIFVRLPETVGWDSHNSVILAMDMKGHLHVSGNMHVSPLVYFRGAEPLSVNTLERVPTMIGRDEDRVTYPHFFTGPENALVFTYRLGSSGNGNQIYNVYDPDPKAWRRLLDRPLLDGEGQRNAYLYGPVRGPDGYFHLCWIWRETPDCSTCHDIGYARSRDLVHWENSRGEPIFLPMTLATCETVDPVPVRGGAINGNVKIGFDARNRPVLSYHKFDTNGFTQVYNTRLEEGQWKSCQATEWRHRWDFSGGGSIEFEVRVGSVGVDAQGRLVQRLSNPWGGSGAWLLDDATLRALRRLPVVRPYPTSLSKVRSDVVGMKVHMQPCFGQGDKGASLWLRWESLGPNRDRPRPGPPPPPSLLQVYEIKGETLSAEEGEEEL